MNIFYKLYYYFTQSSSALLKACSSSGDQAVKASETATSASISTIFPSQEASAATYSTNLCFIRGIGFLMFDIILGIKFGAYSTNHFCEEYLDKFVDYYKITLKIY